MPHTPLPNHTRAPTNQAKVGRQADRTAAINFKYSDNVDHQHTADGDQHDERDDSGGLKSSGIYTAEGGWDI